MLVQQLGLPRKVALTALIFMKRFYLSKSVVEADPARFMLTSVYLACKVGRRVRCGCALRQQELADGNANLYFWPLRCPVHV